MSDTDEDFASADEGELGASAKVSEGTKEQKEKRKSSPAVKAKVPDQKLDDKKLDDKITDTDKVAAKYGNITVDAKPKQGLKKGKGGSRSGKEREKKSTELKSEDSPNHKAVSGEAKTGMRKGGKGKNVDNELKARMEKTKTDIEKSEDVGEEIASKETNADNDKCCNSNVKQESETNTSVLKPTDYEETSDNSQKSGDKAENSEKQIHPEFKLESSDSTIKNVLTSEDSAELKNTPVKEISPEPQKRVTDVEKVAMIKSPSSQNIARPEPDHTVKEEAVLDRLAGGTEAKKSGWGWGWGSSLLDVASTSVSTFTSQVGEGLHTMIETVESTLNVPNPEELAQTGVNKKEVDDKQCDGGSKDWPESGVESKVIDTADSQGKTSPEPDDQSIKSEKADEQLANTEHAERQSVKMEHTEPQTSEAGEKADNQSGEGWFSAWGVSNITKMVESTGKTLVTGSLDVLETLGKKTFDVINDHDPGLKKARGFLHDRGDKPNLSAMLRDAKEQQEARTQQEKESEEARKAHFGSLFDDFQGLAHLEALEMLSNQSEKRVNVLLSPEAISTLKPRLLEIKQNFMIEDTEEEEVTEQEFGLLVTSLLKELNVGTTPVKLLKTHDRIDEHVTKCCEEVSELDVKEIHRLAISSLAELTSKCIEQFHKTGELMLIHKTTIADLVHCSDTLLRLTKVLTAEVGILSTKFSDCLNKHDGDEIKVNHLVTNIYLEACNSGSYVQDGFQLLLPVFQQVAIEKSQEPES